MNSIAPELLKRPRKRRIVLWALLALFLAAIAWGALSDNPFAQIFQEVLGRTHDQTVLDKTFTISPRGFRYYTFSLTAESSKMSVIGQFSAARGNAVGSAGNSGSDGNIEFYLLDENAFTAWSHGQTARSIYESRQVSNGRVQVDLPAGAGNYYLVFSNKFSSDAGETVTASLVLHNRNWTDWFRRRG